MRRLSLGINFLVPIVVVGILVLMVLIRINTTTQIQKSALRGNRAAAVIACDAVHDAGTDQHKFLVKSFGQNPDRKTQTFLTDLKVSVEDNYLSCLTKAATLGDSNGKASRKGQ